MSSDRAPGAGDTPEPGDAGRTADEVAAAVLDVPGVSDLHGGVLGEVATYLPGRRVAGVRLRDAEDGTDGAAPGAEVHIVLDWNSPARATADLVRSRVEELVPGPVHVVVEDVSTPTPPSHHPEPKDS